MSNGIFYVYQYLDSNGLPYYIGKGSFNRINESHLPWVILPSKENRQIVKANLGRKDDGRYLKTSQTMKGRPWSEARRLAQQQKQVSKEL
jgi:hypothetical protein